MLLLSKPHQPETVRTHVECSRYWFRQIRKDNILIIERLTKTLLGSVFKYFEQLNCHLWTCPESFIPNFHCLTYLRKQVVYDKSMDKPRSEGDSRSLCLHLSRLPGPECLEWKIIPLLSSFFYILKDSNYDTSFGSSLYSDSLPCSTLFVWAPTPSVSSEGLATLSLFFFGRWTTGPSSHKVCLPRRTRSPRPRPTLNTHGVVLFGVHLYTSDSVYPATGLFLGRQRR